MAARRTLPAGLSASAMLYRAFLLALATVHAWNDCAFPDVGYYAVDEGLGLSFAYGASGMNGKLYTGGYYKGHFALVGVTDSGEVSPNPAATLWGDVTSDVQNLYVAETDATGKMTNSWSFKGTGIQDGGPGHGPIVNRVQVDGVVSMLDNAHLAIMGDFSAQVTLPDGTVWSQGRHTDGTVRQNTNDNVQFVMKLDVSSDNGVGSGTSGWARVLDEDHLGNTIHPGGVDSSYVTDVHGDANGDMILTYTGYASYNASASYKDRYGRDQCCGMMTDPTHYIVKLSAADGSEVWKHAVPKALRFCTPITDGSIFCGYTMKSSDGTVDWGNGQTMPAVTVTTAGIVKFDSNGVAQWAKPTHEATFAHMAVSPDGNLMAITGDMGRGNMDLLSRISTSDGSVLWTDNGSGGGTHGFRGVQVHSDGTQVTTFGQINEGSPLTLTDSEGSKATVTSRGSYTIWVAAYDAADGTGKWTMDAGSDGLDYFFAFGIDRVTNDIYVGGGVYDTPEAFVWGDVKRPNVMRQYEPSADISGYVGTTKGFTAQIKSTSSPPDCLHNTCSAVVGPQAVDVKDGHCYIERHCYSAGDFAPYPGQHCMKCDPTTAAGRLGWSAPDTTSMCFIGGKCIDEGVHEQVVTGMGRRGPTYGDDPCSKCIPSVSGTEYTAITGGCMLDMATFKSACYDDKGLETMNETARIQLMAEKATMMSTVATRDATIAAQADTIDELKTTKIQLQADLSAAVTCKEASDKTPTWAIAIIAVIGAMFVVVLLTLAVIVMREQQGKPVFMPLLKNGPGPTAAPQEWARA